MPGRWNTIWSTGRARCPVPASQDDKEGCSFLKKEPKNFYPFAPGEHVGNRVKVFLLLFLQKKKILAFSLPFTRRPRNAQGCHVRRRERCGAHRL
jgi:hypothetical protein